VIDLDIDDKKYNEVIKQPGFYKNKLPPIFKEKEKELIRFYKDMLSNL